MVATETVCPLNPRSSQFLNGKTVRICGPLMSMSLREVSKLIRSSGGRVLTSAEIESGTMADWMILGERPRVFADTNSQDVPDWLTDSVREDIECGFTHLATETQLLQRLFPSDEKMQDLTSLYTPVMLAELLHVTVSDVRRWYLRGLIAPVRVIKRLPYFDLQEVFSARQLSTLLQNGVKHPSIEKKLKALRRINPGVLPLLANNDLVIQGRNVFLRQNDSLLESTGQMLLDFETIENEQADARDRAEEELPPNLQQAPERVADYTLFDSSRAFGTLESLFSRSPSTEFDDESEGEFRDDDSDGKIKDERGAFSASSSSEAALTSAPVGSFEKLPVGMEVNRISIAQMRASALELEEAGHLEDAAEMYRNLLFAVGANAQDAFQLGDLLYRLGNLNGARERFSMAIELDEDFVEARVNLGIVLGELGDIPLAVSALEGAISYHGDYAEAYFHLAQLLEREGRRIPARCCYRKFLELTESRKTEWSRIAQEKLQELAESEE